MDHLERRTVGPAELVDCMQTGAGVGRDPQGDGERERRTDGADVAIELAEGLSVDQLHRMVEDAAVLTDLEDARDVLVVDLRGDPRLVQEHVAELTIVAVRREDRLQRDETLEAMFARQAREPDGAHAALREHAEQLIAVETIPRRKRGRGGRCEAPHEIQDRADGCSTQARGRSIHVRGAALGPRVRRSATPSLRLGLAPQPPQGSPPAGVLHPLRRDDPSPPPRCAFGARRMARGQVAICGCSAAFVFEWFSAGRR